MSVSQFHKVSITVADPAKAASFLRDGLGLTSSAARTIDDPAFVALLGLEAGARAWATDVLVGRQALELMTFDPPGAPYPAERFSNDQWFQHVALVCGDIDDVWRRLAAHRPGVITAGAPVRLPRNTGKVAAFKFRDPEGHPLELISFPPGIGAVMWHEMTGGGVLGYDHSAIVVADLERSLSFYTSLLGFAVAGRSLNRGPEQDRLDGLSACAVDVVALEPAAGGPPHVELLHYRAPVGRMSPGAVRANDVASARQIHAVAELDSLMKRLVREGVRFVSPGVVRLRDGTRAVAVRDPDGHMLVLRE
jgi:catechol 2,3-dioxygenase-like lactoylglutathione lyase family enzyme